MANAVRSISSLSADSGTLTRSVASTSSTDGKSLADRLARVKRLRPACTVTLSPVCETATLLPSGRARTMSNRSEEHTSELQSLMRISYAVFGLQKKKEKKTNKNN